MHASNTGKTSLTLIALLIFSVSGSCLAKSSDREQNAVIDGGYYRINPETGADEFSNGFNLVQGTLNITSEEATIYRTEEGLTRIVLTGNPVTWVETLDDGSNLDARANRIDYDLETENVHMMENVRVQKGLQEITGQDIRYNLKTQNLEGGSQEEGSRFRMIIKPKSKSDS